MSNGSMLKKFALAGLFVLLTFGFTAMNQKFFAQDAAAEPAPVVEAEAESAAEPAPVAEVEAESATESAPAAEAEAEPAAETESAEEILGDTASAPVVVDQGVVVQKKSTGKAFMTFGLVAAVILISWLLSVFFSKKWRMPDYQTRYFIVLFCFLAALISTIAGLAQHRMNLGIDLRGGSILVYGVTPNEIEGEETSETTINNQQMSELKAALGRRINPAGVKEIAIQELGNNAEVKITIPEADEAEVARIERIINSAGQLKFRILASTGSPEEKELIDKANSAEFAALHDIRLAEPIGKDRIIIGGTWFPVDPTQINDIAQLPGVVVREASEVSDAAAAEGHTKSYEVLVLELAELYDIYGKHMAMVREGIGDRGQPEVRFTMTNEGAERMKHLTDRYKAGADRARGRQLGIVMNDSLYSAPEIKATIERDGVINMGGENMSAESRERIQKDVRDLIQVMNAGVLPAKLTEQPVTKMLTGPTLGEDTIQKGKNSIIWGGVLVLVFMIAYYGFGGVVASFAVIMNLTLIMAVMLGLRAAFTLPGLAGLVLTVGMAVDANVLIFERIKEELNGGATLKMAILNGFQRAFSAIFDSNITTMITAVILYTVGTDQIKGFAVTLFLGVAFSLFTATYVSRVIFETADKLGFIGKKCVYPILPGLKPFGKTNFNFMGLKRITMMISLIAIVVGILGVFGRGKGIFDIDFVGGVEVQAIFDSPQQISDIRSKLKALPDLSVSNLSLSKDRAGNEVQDNCCFTISTSCPPDRIAEEYRTDVEKTLHEAFGDTLRHTEMTIGAVSKSTEHIAGVDVTKVTVDLTINPPVAREVIAGYFEDELEAFIAAKNLPELKFEAVGHDDMKERNNAFGDWKIAFETDDEPLAKEFADQVAKDMTGRSTFESSQTIGSSVASYARMQGILAIFGSLICIILYIWFRFKKVVFGLSAVIALFHDVLITLGFIALSLWLAPFLGFAGVSEFKIGLPTVAAFLTIIGYSLNDTIILFDRMREICGKSQELDEQVINKAINQTLSRTILTSLTTLFVAVVLYFFGGGGIHTFSFALCVGIFAGTYSSVFIASPVLLWMLKMKESKQK